MMDPQDLNGSHTQISNDEILRKIYYSVENPAGFTSINKLYKEAKEVNRNITQSYVKEWLKAQLPYTLHRGARRNYIRDRIVVTAPDEQWEADLVEMQEFSRVNRGYRYILNVIDSFSKYAWSVPLKSKTARDVAKAFKLILKQRVPGSVRTDKGKEFLNASLQNVLRGYGIRHYVSNNPSIKCAIVERFNRTLKTRMYKYFTANGTRKYYDILNKLISAYNNSYHRSIKMKPVEVTRENKNFVFKNLYGAHNLLDLVSKDQKTTAPKFSIGDSVRMKYVLGPFDKSFYPNWTDQIYFISNIDKSGTRFKYSLNNYDGSPYKDRKFYTEELQHVKESIHRIEKILRRKVYKGKIMYFVKWLGYSSSHNSWIMAEDLQRLH